MTAPTQAPALFPHRHLLGIEGLSRPDIETLLDAADAAVDISRQVEKKRTTLRGRTQINLFFEPSTRTQSSFELAGKRLGADVMNMSVASSSVKKGETLIDTAATLNAMRPDIIVVRHQAAGAVHLLARKVDCAVVNAGDGAHEHPTQALLDALTIRRNKGGSRGCASHLWRCPAFAGGALEPDPAPGDGRAGPPHRALDAAAGRDRAIRRRDLHRHAQGAGRLRHRDDAAPSARAHERLLRPLGEGVFPLLRPRRDKLALAKPDALVMHPGPMNRGVEISSEIADGAQSLIREQVEMGVAVEWPCSMPWPGTCRTVSCRNLARDGSDTARPFMSTYTLADLARLVASRAGTDPSSSYTAKLLADGPAKAAKKLGEEAVEAAIAAVQGTARV
ncbi:hypothetical protein Lal_00014662 [Lupinus albus]|nr:hypothetical protein Lal_00014662 [Lupinus albus]